MTDTTEIQQADPFQNDPILKDMGAFLHSLNNESDRGVVLVCTSYIEDRLGILISKFLVNGSDSKALIDDFNGPFGTFSSRISGAHALGLISNEEMRRLTIIRKIRNDFAHELRASFETQKIKSRLDTFKHYIPSENGPQELTTLEPRMRFTMAAARLVVCLCNMIQLVDQRQLKPQVWPDF